MSGYFLGIDLGTSSVKVLAKSPNGKTVKAKSAYDSVSPKGWIDGLKRALKILFESLSPSEIEAVGLSSQVGTYVLGGEKVIGWQSAVGKEELDEIKRRYDDSYFIDKISMAHPDLISYPLPRLSFVKKNYPFVKKVVGPKEILTEYLTGGIYTDKFSQRGVYNFAEKRYATEILSDLGIEVDLPEVLEPTDLCGSVTGRASEESGLIKGTPVYVGCNDFFAGLLGMGVYKEGTAFELSGTSEHIGAVTDELCLNCAVSGNYFNKYVSYGGTKSSGKACAFAIENFSLKASELSPSVNKRPIFLPYLQGERAPIFDENARGVFFGISTETGREDMAYSAFEGIAFGLYDIYRTMEKEIKGDRIICGGGSTVNRLLNRIKAELFGKEIVLSSEADASALGAAMIAMTGAGVYSGFEDCISENVGYEYGCKPTGEYTDILRKRFALFQKLYNDNKNNFILFKEI